MGEWDQGSVILFNDAKNDLKRRRNRICDIPFLTEKYIS